MIEPFQCANLNSGEQISCLLLDSSLQIKHRKIIEQEQEMLIEHFKQTWDKIISPLQIFKQKIQDLQSELMKQFYTILNMVDEWRLNLEAIGADLIKKDLFEKSNQKLSFSKKLEMQENKINNLTCSWLKKIEQEFQLDKLVCDISQALQEFCKILFNSEYDQNWQRQTDQQLLMIPCPRHPKNIIQFVNIEPPHQIGCDLCEKPNCISIQELLKKYDHQERKQKQYYEDIKNKRIKHLLGKKDDLIDLLILQMQSLPVAIKGINENIIQIIQTNKHQQNNQNIIIDMISEINQNFDDFKLKFENESKLIDMTANNKRLEIFHNLDYSNQKVLQSLSVEFEFDYSQIELEEIPIEAYKIGGTMCYTMAFNARGDRMISGSSNYIQFWEFQNGKLKQLPQREICNNGNVVCLQYSRVKEWFFCGSGNGDFSITLWKQIGQTWIKSEPLSIHQGGIWCLTTNSREDQLFSGSADSKIGVWKINYLKNELTLEYFLVKHTKQVFSISLNESNTSFVSSGFDKRIIVWRKNHELKWEFQQQINQLTNDFGCKIYFLSDSLIVWQQYRAGYLHFFKLINGEFIVDPSLQVELNKLGNDGQIFAETIYNKQKHLLVNKYKDCIYLLKQQQLGKFEVIQKFQFETQFIYFTLSHDARFLITWEMGKNEIQEFKINYS